MKSRFSSKSQFGLSDKKRALLRKRLQEEGIAMTPQPGISRRSCRDSAPLSFAQQRLWLVNQLDPLSPAYNFPAAFRITGKLNVATFERSLNELVCRHEALRTIFPEDGEHAVQRIMPELKIGLSRIDLSATPASQQMGEIEKDSAREVFTPFDLSLAPLLRAKLFKLGECEHVFLLVLHHIISDGWSLGIVMRDLMEIYSGREAALPELKIQYADFSVWQRECLTPERLSTQIEYWKKKLERATFTLDLPSDRPRLAHASGHGARHAFQIPKETTEALKRLSRAEGATLFMGLLAVFYILLHRYTGSRDIVVASPTAGRNRSETENLAGFFLNMLMLRTGLFGDPNYKTILARVRETAREAFEHADAPFDLLAGMLQPSGRSGSAPLFQVMFVLQSAPISISSPPEMTITPVETGRPASICDLTLQCAETPVGLSAFLEYSTDLFNASSIDRMALHFVVLLRNLIDNPERRISEISMLPAQERELVLSRWNWTQADYPRGRCVHEFFESQAARTPDAIALIFGHEKLTYGDLDRRANQLAHYLRRLNLDIENLAGICLDRSPNMVIAVLAVLKCGAAYVPLDPSLPRERLRIMIDDSQISVLLTESRLLQQFPQDELRLVCMDLQEQELAQEVVYSPEVPVQSGNLAYVIYTSGSTGKPKGVQITHDSLLNLLCAIRRKPGMNAHDTVLAITTLSFDIAALELFLPLICGARIELLRRETVADGLALKEQLGKSSATVLQATPATWQMLNDAGWEGNPKLTLFCGGEALSLPLAGQLLKKGNALWNMYGPTESTIYSSISEVEPDGPVLIGAPIGNTQFYILDSRMNLAPIGVPGELFIGGDGLARGYLNRPDLTAEKFIPNPFSGEPGARMYRTGDLCCWREDGEVDYLGRLDQQVKIRGYRIELGEIETLAQNHPAVKQAVATALENTVTGKSVALYVILQPGFECPPAELKTFMKARLPDYMIPAAIVFLDAFPLTPSGKIDRRALPLPRDVSGESDEADSPPANPVEMTLAEIWKEVLNLKEIGTRRNFFELGGHSLLGTRVIMRIRRAFNLDLPLAVLFDAPTITELAEYIIERQIDNAGSDEVEEMLAELELGDARNSTRTPMEPKT